MLLIRILYIFSNFYFFIIFPDIAIGGTEYIEKGQNIEVTCNATSPSPNYEPAPSIIQWFKGSEKLESSPESPFLISQHVVGKTLYSTLIVYKAELEHTGDYICRVPDLKAAERFKVTVLNGNNFPF